MQLHAFAGRHLLVRIERNVAASPNRPTGRPSRLAPSASHASSSIATPEARQAVDLEHLGRTSEDVNRARARSTGSAPTPRRGNFPPSLTAMDHASTASTTFAGSMVSVPGSMSTKRGCAFVEDHVHGCDEREGRGDHQIPFVTPAAITPMCSAAHYSLWRPRTARPSMRRLPARTLRRGTGRKPAGLDRLAHELNVAVVNAR